MLERHLQAADLCHARQEAEALPLLRQVVNGWTALQVERPDDSAPAWRLVLALHSLGIAALVVEQQAEAATAAATALHYARRAQALAGEGGAGVIVPEIATLERLQAATGAGFVYLAADGGEWPYGG